MQQLASGQTYAEVVINDNFQTLSHQAVYGKNHETTAGLTFGYYGGIWGSFTVADGTQALGASTTTYMVVLRSSGAVSFSTSNTNWNNSTSYARAYRLVTSASAITTTEDHRGGPGGAHGQISGGVALTDGDKGDITVSSSGAIWAVDNDVVTNAKLANMATASIKGRTTAGTGDPEDLTAAQAAAIVQGDGLDVDAAGFRGIPQNSQSGNYTFVAGDAGKHILHPSGGGSGDTFTIPANASVAYEIGTSITVVNRDSNSVSIAITSDTMYLANSTTTGARTLAQNGVATAIKVEATVWIISGVGLT